MSGKKMNITWEKKTDYDCYLGPLDYHWKNVPHGFNPDFKPYAEAISKATTQSLIDEGVYEKYTLKERQDLNLWRNRYDELMERYETSKGINRK